MHANIVTSIKNDPRKEFGMEVMNIVRIIRKNDPVEFHKDPATKNQFRMMLWHGTHYGAVVPILKQGFKLPGAKGQRFGRGLYFAELVSKCAW